MPEQNAGGAPVITIARTSASWLARTSASLNSTSIAWLIALRTCGRSSVMRACGPRTSYLMAVYPIHSSDRCLPAMDYGSTLHRGPILILVELRGYGYE